MINKKIAIIGFGNMGHAIKDGIFKKKLIGKDRLLISNKQLINKIVAKQSDILIIAVKPQVIKTVLEEIKNVVSKNILIISIAAGVEIKVMEKYLGKDTRIIRVMPNLCARVNQSISCWVKNKNVSYEDTINLKRIFQSIGKEFELKNEKMLDQVTAISGSGPAYVFYLAELLIRSATKIGLEKKLAHKLVSQTLVGSSGYFEKSKESPEILRQNVTSKGGTTEAAFNKIINSEFESIFLSAIESAYKRAIELHLKV